MSGVYVGVGSSIDPHVHIPSGLRRLHVLAHVAACSRFYRTPALDRPGDPDFVNGVVRLDTTLAPRPLRTVLRMVESLEGRQRGADPYAPRTLDLDLLLHGDLRVDDGDLALPDPDVLRRPWLAAGLLDLDPGLRLPDGSALERPSRPLTVEPGLDPTALLGRPAAASP